MKGKKYDNGLLKTEVIEDGKKVRFEIKTADIKWLFKNSPNNPCQSNVKRGKEQEFLDYVLKNLSEESRYDDNTVKWLMPLEEIFTEILEGYEEFINYKEV